MFTERSDLSSVSAHPYDSLRRGGTAVDENIRPRNGEAGVGGAQQVVHVVRQEKRLARQSRSLFVEALREERALPNEDQIAQWAVLRSGVHVGDHSTFLGIQRSESQ